MDASFASWRLRVRTDTNAVDDCLHLADYIRAARGGDSEAEEEKEEEEEGALCCVGGGGRGKWMEDPKEEEEWADRQEGTN